MRNKKRNKYLLLLALLLLVTVGYALISTTLKINGTATVTKQTWNVYWGVPTVTEGSVTTTPPTRTQDQDDPANTKLIWTTTLNLPGDYYEFTVDAVNAGTIDAMITGINNTVTPTLPEYIKYNVTYADGVAIGENHLLAKQTGANPTTEKYKVRVYYDEAAATASTINNMTSDTQYTFTFNVTYGQATSDAKAKPVIVLPEGKTKDNLTTGDTIKIKNEEFNFIRYDGNDVVMLAKHNLKVGGDYHKESDTWVLDKYYTNSDPGYGMQNSELIDTDTNYFSHVAFSSVAYWWDDGKTYEDDYMFDMTYYKKIYDASYIAEPDFSTTCDDTTNCWNTPNYSVAYFVEQYKTRLIDDYNIRIKEARLLYSGEYTDLINDSSQEYTFLSNHNFWLGSGPNVCVIVQQGAYGDFSLLDSIDIAGGVRPVIVVEKSDL